MQIKSAKGEWVDFESRPQKAVTFVVERGKERQEWNEQELPKAPPEKVEEDYQEQAQRERWGRRRGRRRK